MPPPFTPLFRSPHLQTVVAHYWPRRPSPGSPVERRLFTTEPGVQVLVESQRPAAPPVGHVVLVHGLEGSSQAGYMLSLSGAALRAGFAAHRLNLRSCGGTAHLCPTLYHGGLTTDLLAVIRELRLSAPEPIHIAGFSLGGNIVLKLAGELGECAAGLIARVAAVSTPIDLGACVDRMRRFDNRIYERRFVFHMLRRMRATGRYSRRRLAGLRTIFDVDDRITAPEFGFGRAPDYYRSQSALGFLPAIRVPTLLIQAQDDTYVPFEIYRRQAVRSNPLVKLLAPEHGGHIGFLARGPQRFWLDEAIMDWFQ